MNDKARITDCHPEQSEAESKDRVELLFHFAAGFLDFARNDVRLICPSSFDLPSSFVIRISSFQSAVYCALRTSMNASCGMLIFPMLFIRFFPSFCFSNNFRLRVISPP